MLLDIDSMTQGQQYLGKNFSVLQFLFAKDSDLTEPANPELLETLHRLPYFKLNKQNKTIVENFYKRLKKL